MIKTYIVSNLIVSNLIVSNLIVSNLIVNFILKKYYIFVAYFLNSFYNYLNAAPFYFYVCVLCFLLRKVVLLMRPRARLNSLIASNAAPRL